MATTMNTPSTKQAEVLNFLKSCLAKNGFQPSFAEMAAHFGFKSPNSITLHLSALERKGLITRSGPRSRAISITDAGPATTAEAQAIAESQAIADQYLSLSENGRRHLRALVDSLVKLDTGA